jgi:hypothetical protein
MKIILFSALILAGISVFCQGKPFIFINEAANTKTEMQII